MLRFMVFCYILSFVLVMDGFVWGAMAAFGLAIVTPVAYIGWHVLAE